VFYDAHLRDSKQRVVAPPAFSAGVQIADTHAHLDMLHNPGLTLARAAAHNVSFIVSVIDPTEEPDFTLKNLVSWQQEARELTNNNKEMTASNDSPSLSAACEVVMIIGCHPHNAKAYTQEVEDKLVQAVTGDERVVGIGEIGLDYHYDNSPRDVQQKVYRRQIQLAHEHKTSITLHMREAHADGLRILKEEGVPAKGILLHCFNLDYATLEPFLEMGAYVAFGGPLTFKKADDVRSSAARCPIDRVMTETDCPFMAPVPIRGTVCEPASTVFVADVLRNLRSEPDALQQAYANARRFFKR